MEESKKPLFSKGGEKMKGAKEEKRKYVLFKDRIIVLIK